jgi:CIC family chloride channel protein
MGAVVAGATLAPLTGVLMMFELTGSYQIVLPLLVACGASAAVVQGALGGSIYSIGARRRGIRVGVREQSLRDLSVAQALAPLPDGALSGPVVLPDDDLESALAAMSGHACATVNDAQGRRLGIVTREGILEAWRKANS